MSANCCDGQYMPCKPSYQDVDPTKMLLITMQELLEVALPNKINVRENRRDTGNNGHQKKPQNKNARPHRKLERREIWTLCAREE